MIDVLWFLKRRLLKWLSDHPMDVGKMQLLKRSWWRWDRGRACRWHVPEALQSCRWLARQSDKERDRDWLRLINSWATWSPNARVLLPLSKGIVAWLLRHLKLDLFMLYCLLNPEPVFVYWIQGSLGYGTYSPLIPGNASACPTSRMKGSSMRNTSLEADRRLDAGWMVEGRQGSPRLFSSRPRGHPPSLAAAGRCSRARRLTGRPATPGCGRFPSLV